MTETPNIRSGGVPPAPPTAKKDPYDQDIGVVLVLVLMAVGELFKVASSSSMKALSDQLAGLSKKQIEITACLKGKSGSELQRLQAQLSNIQLMISQNNATVTSLGSAVSSLQSSMQFLVNAIGKTVGATSSMV
jgi:peptidoglycan hydrolase CwlO-like protein